MNRFTDKVALITGAASGIGRATAQRLAEEGATLFLADIDIEGLKLTVATLPENTRVHSESLDVSSPDACRRIVAQAADHFGRLDVLCNIAGIPMFKHLADITEDDWSRIVSINLTGVFFLCQAAMPELIKTGGNIINMSSSAGRTGQAYNSAYCATKGAVLMLSKALAVEFAGQGVRVNAVCPGAVETPLAASFELPEGSDPALFQRLFPLMDVSKPEEIAAAIGYLASAEARFVTGAEFAIDGGQTAG